MVLDAWQSLFYGDLENYDDRTHDSFFSVIPTAVIAQLKHPWLNSTRSDWLTISLHFAVITSTGSKCSTFHETLQTLEIVGYHVSIN